jgi:hypothetical protein
MSISAFKQQAQQRIKESSTTLNQPEGWPSRFFYDADVAHFVSFLHPYDQHMPLQVHTKKLGPKKYVTKICNAMYGLECDDCEEGVNRSNIFNFLGFVHTLDGVTREIKSGKRAGEEVDEEPFRIIEIRAGRGQANMGELLDADRGGYFHKKVWQIKKTGEGTDTVYLPPTTVPEEKLGSQFSNEIPAYVKAALTPPKGLTQEQLIAAYLIAPYGNNKSALEVMGIPFSIDEIAKMLEETRPKAAKQSDKLK